jgi:hypothetical protein
MTCSRCLHRRDFPMQRRDSATGLVSVVRGAATARLQAYAALQSDRVRGPGHGAGILSTAARDCGMGRIESCRYARKPVRR